MSPCCGSTCLVLAPAVVATGLQLLGQVAVACPGLLAGHATAIIVVIMAR